MHCSDAYVSQTAKLRFMSFSRSGSMYFQFPVVFYGKVKGRRAAKFRKIDR